MNIEIRSTVLTFVIIAAIAAVILIFQAVRAIRRARRLPFFFKRRQAINKAIRLIFIAMILIGAALLAFNFGEPVIYKYFPPTLTPTQTFTVTLTPTITLTPTETLTPTITNTPSVTNTPSIPTNVEALFEGIVTPNPNSVFSPIQFSRRLSDQNLPVNPAVEFENPVGRLYGAFSYNDMQDGVQWTALWLYQGKLVHFETATWNGGPGGYGYTDWEPDAEAWLPGLYEVQIFVGMDWKVSGYFTVTGNPPTSSPTPTRTLTPTPTLTRTATRTPQPTDTKWPTPTP